MVNRVDQTDFPRITLKCNKCGNEFQINVLRFNENESIFCQVCGSQFSKEIGEKFAQALHDLFEVKHQLERDQNAFQFSFVYKSNHAQPPVPYTFTQE